MARLIGDAFIVIYPQTDQFGALADAGIKKQLAALKPSVDVRPRLDKSAAAAMAAEMRAAADKLDVKASLSPQSMAAVRAELDALGKNVNVGASIDPARIAAVRQSINSVLDNGVVSLDTRKAVADIDTLKGDTAALQQQLESLRSNIDDTGAEAKLARLQAQAEALATALDKAGDDASLTPLNARLLAIAAAFEKLNAEKIDTNTAQANSAVAALVERADQLRADLANMRADINDTGAEAKLAALQAQAAKLSRSLIIAPADADLEPFEARLLGIQAAIEKIAGERLSVNTTQANSAVTALISRIKQLNSGLLNLRARVNDTEAEAQLAALQVKTTALVRAMADAGSAADFAPFEAQLAGIEDAYGRIHATQVLEDGELVKQTSLWQKFGLQGAGSLIHVTDLMNASIPPVRLFGGAIGDAYRAMAGNELPTFASHLVSVATSAHLTTEAVIEFAAVWVPATLAMAAFAATATPTVIEIGKQLNNMNIAAQGTGRSFNALQKSGQSLIQTVQPSVLEAFGIALYALQNKSTTLGSAMKTLGGDIDQMAAKAAVAFDRGSGTFFTGATRDANALMVSFQDLGSILGTLMKAVPGYAEVLLNFGNGLLGVAADATKFAEPFLAQFLKLHGALLYGGLLGTAASWVFPKIVAGATAATEAVAAMAASFLASDSVIVESLGKVLLGMDALSAGPVIAGVGLLVGAIAAVTIALKASNTAANSFNSSIQSTLQNTAVTSLPQALASDLAQANAKVASSQTTLAQTTQAAVKAQKQAVFAGRAGVISSQQLGTAVMKAAQSAASYSAGQQQLSQQSKNLNLNLGAIAGTFGTSIPGALALANAAQVTSNQLLSNGAANWAVISTMIAGYISQLKVMVPGAGALNQALNALNVTSSQQVTDAQKLAQAYSSWIGIVTSGDQGFTTFEQGQLTLSSALNASAGKTVAFTDKLGNLTVKGTAAGASMNGLSAASLNARQAFDSQIQAAVTLYGNLQTMSVVSGSTTASTQELAKAGKDLVAQMLPLAKGSQRATADVYALAQVVGYTGKDSYAALAKWLGTTKGAAADLDKQQTALTVSTANLTQAAKNLSAAMQSDVAAGESAAIVQATHLTAIQGQLATAVENSNGKFTQAAQTLAGQYYEALIKSGAQSTVAKQDVDAFLTRMGATPSVVDTVNKAIDKLPKQVTVNFKADTTQANSAVAALEAQLAQVHGSTVYVNEVTRFYSENLGSSTSQGREAGGLVTAAAGRLVRGRGPSGKDSTPILAAPGELVVPTSHVAAFHDMARRASIPGFNGTAIRAGKSKTGTVASKHHYADGGIPEPVLGFGTGSWGLPYSFAQSAPVLTGTDVALGSGLQPMTSYQATVMIDLMRKQNQLLQQMPYAYASAINQAQAAGVRRGWFATSG